MIAIAATLQPTQSPQLLDLVAQRFHQRFPNRRTRDDRTVVQVPTLGSVLITEEPSSMRLDFVVANEAAAALAVMTLEDEIRTQVRDREMLVRWDRPTIVPAALR